MHRILYEEKEDHFWKARSVLKVQPMTNAMTIDQSKKQSTRALEATNFFLADVQTGLGPFLAAYLAGSGWQPGRVGMALTVGGIITVVLQAPAGAIVDQVRSKRLILVLASAVLAAGAILLSFTASPWAVYTSQVLIGGAGPFLGPTLAAVTMGIVGVHFFDRQFGKNQSLQFGGERRLRASDRRHESFFGKPLYLHHRGGSHHSHGNRRSRDQE